MVYCEISDREQLSPKPYFKTKSVHRRSNMPKSEIKDTNLLLQIIKESRSDFSVIREAISNSFDAGASAMNIFITQNKSDLNQRLDIVFQDNGCGMSLSKDEPPSVFNFFNVADSGKTGLSQIGEKGVGTKLFFNSMKLEVFTKRPGEDPHYWVMGDPVGNLEKGDMPEFIKCVKSDDIGLMDKTQGTTIVITGLKVSSTNQFVVDDKRTTLLKDYINFFTAAGNIRKYIKGLSNPDFCVNVFRWEQDAEKQTDPDFTVAGHIFPKDNINPKDNEGNVSPEDFVYRFGPIVTNIYYYDSDGQKIRLDMPITIMGIISGTNGHTIGSGGQWYKGLFLAKDGFIIRSYNDIINDQSWYSYRIIANCQGIELNLGRDDFRNTSSQIFKAIETTLKDFISSIIKWRKPENYNQTKAVAWQSNNYDKKNILPINKICPDTNGIEQPGVPFAEEGYRLLTKFKVDHELSEEIKKMNVQKRTYEDEIKKESTKFIKLPESIIKGISFEPMWESSAILVFQSMLEKKLIYKVKNHVWVDFGKYKIIQHFTTGVDFLVCKLDNNNTSLHWIEAEYLLKNALTHEHPLSTLYAITCWDLDESIKNQFLQDGKAQFINKGAAYTINRDEYGYYIAGGNLDQRVKIFVLRKIYADMGLMVEPNYKENGGTVSFVNE